MNRAVAARHARTDDFKAAFRTHAGGVALVTADNGTDRAALTATSVSSVSVDPNLLLFSVSAAASAAPVLLTATSVVVHLLDADDLALARLGSTSGVDRFADTSLWSRLPTGEPFFPGVRTRICGTVVERLSLGTSTVVVVEATQVVLPDDGRTLPPLVHHDRTWHRLDEGSRIR
ncbi:flavin reductase [Cryptosporangium sp. NPDC048952]|uniref:flavin reductase n=1 Tax=Cryptosporangium sp. NPDC048952 TaxID=3363961 RepID=UPI00371BCFAB